MLLRTIADSDRDSILELYRYLHPVDDPLPEEAEVARVWATIRNDPKIHCFVAETEGRLVATCLLTLIPNLTRGARPYGLIENVVTHPEVRNQGIGTRLLRHALETAWKQNAYKVMLLTSSRRGESLHHFYEQAGFRKGIKTGFVATPNAA